MTIASSLIPELEQESAATRRVLERIPGDQLPWRPHRKSYSLGQLALHVARIPSDLVEMARPGELQLSEVSFGIPDDRTKAQILEAFESSLASAKAYLAAVDDAAAMSTWRLRHGDIEVMAMPRIGLLRGLMFNHLYHHRGQLLVYLRLLDVPVPIVYGATADENPFAALMGGS